MAEPSRSPPVPPLSMVVLLRTSPLPLHGCYTMLLLPLPLPHSVCVHMCMCGQSGHDVEGAELLLLGGSSNCRRMKKFSMRNVNSVLVLTVSVSGDATNDVKSQQENGKKIALAPTGSVCLCATPFSVRVHSMITFFTPSLQMCVWPTLLFVLCGVFGAGNTAHDAAGHWLFHCFKQSMCVCAITLIFLPKCICHWELILLQDKSVQFVCIVCVCVWLIVWLLSARRCL